MCYNPPKRNILNVFWPAIAISQQKWPYSGRCLTILHGLGSILDDSDHLYQKRWRIAKEEVRLACIARLARLYYQNKSRDLSTFPSSQPERSNTVDIDMEILEVNCELFATSNVLYLHCIDIQNRLDFNFCTCFPTNLSERRRAGFLYDDNLDLVERKQFPVVIKVLSSSMIEVIIIKNLFLV